MPASSSVVSSFTFEPGVVLSLGAAGVVYAVGVARAWRAGGVGHDVRRGHAGAFAAAWTTLVVALVSPLDALSDRLFAAHMIQHELLMVVAAPLAVLGSPLVAARWALPSTARPGVVNWLRRRRRARVWAIAASPAAVWLLHAAALWVWHMPALFDAALASDGVHAAQHLCFFGTALLFWWGLSADAYGRGAYGVGVLYVFTTAVHSGLLGALLTFSPRIWYPAYAHTTAAFGLTPLEDQQLGGLIMWVPAGLIYVGVGLWLFAAWIGRAGSRPPIRVATLSTMALAAALVAMSAGCSGSAYRAAASMTGGDPTRGRQLISFYGCDTCHTIPGVRTARGLVGPPLTSVAARVYIGGHIPNTPANMTDWISHPHAHEPHTAMPEMGVPDEDARDLAAFLYTLR
jgi:cytochrome c oxidase assembly factor CtaG